jgi:hypothetical protein
LAGQLRQRKRDRKSAGDLRDASRCPPPLSVPFALHGGLIELLALGVLQLPSSCRALDHVLGDFLTWPFFLRLRTCLLAAASVNP